MFILFNAEIILYTPASLIILKKESRHINNNKKGAKAVKGKLPVNLVYQEQYNKKQSALSRESEIKSLKREEKLDLITKGA